jgi:hypothetical protein
MLSSCDVKLLPWVSIVVLVRLFPSVPPIDRVIGLLSSCLFDEFDSFWNLQGRQLVFFPSSWRLKQWEFSAYGNWQVMDG